MATMILRETHRALEAKMKSLEKLKDETSIKIKEAADHGDLKENGEYHAAREEQSLIIRKTQTLQSYSPFQIIEHGEIETDQVGFGNKVTILEEGKDKPEDYYLLGPIEFEPDNWFPPSRNSSLTFWPSYNWEKVNETFTLNSWGEETKFTITDINKVPDK